MINCFYGKCAQIRSFLTDLFTFIKENFNGEPHFCTMSTNGINIMQEKCLHVFTGKFIVPEVRVAETRSVMSGESLHRIRNFSGPCFLTFGLSTEIYGVSLRIQSEFGKIWNRKTPHTDTSHAVLPLHLSGYLVRDLTI